MDKRIIPDNENVIRYIKRKYIDNNRINISEPFILRKHINEKDLSVYWLKDSIQEIKKILKINFKIKNNDKLAKLEVLEIKKLNNKYNVNLIVKDTSNKQNKYHASIFGLYELNDLIQEDIAIELMNIANENELYEAI